MSTDTHRNTGTWAIARVDAWENDGTVYTGTAAASSDLLHSYRVYQYIITVMLATCSEQQVSNTTTHG